MSDDIIVGSVKQAAGRIEQVAGAAAGDISMELHGAARELDGATQRTFGEAKSEVHAAAGESPAGIFLAGVSVGLVVGLFLSRR